MHDSLFRLNRYRRLLRGLEPQQRRFVREFLIDYRAVRAAIRAGYSQKTARQQASRLLRHQEIHLAIDAGQRLQRQWAEELAARICKRLHSMGMSRFEDLFDDRGNPLPRSEWPAGAEFGIEAITIRSASGTQPAKVLRLQLSNRVRVLSLLVDLLTTIEGKIEAGNERDKRLVELWNECRAETHLHVFWTIFGRGWATIQPDGQPYGATELEADARELGCPAHLSNSVRSLVQMWQSSYARCAKGNVILGQRLRPLDPQQQRFVEEYLQDFNGTAAAIRAGYSAKTARQQASRLQAKPAVRKAIEAGQREGTAIAEDISRRTHRRLEAFAFASVTDFLDELGNLRPRKDWPAGAELAVRSIRTRVVSDRSGKSTITQIKLTDRPKALAMLVNLLAARDDAALPGDREFNSLSLPEQDFVLLYPVMGIYLKKGWRITDADGNDFRLETLEEQLLKALGLEEPAV